MEGGVPSTLQQGARAEVEVNVTFMWIGYTRFMNAQFAEPTLEETVHILGRVGFRGSIGDAISAGSEQWERSRSLAALRLGVFPGSNA